ncbi:hypothetical protein EBZ80_20835 [bacterium]|nr:hypothetical protein [bacterium]
MTRDEIIRMAEASWSDGDVYLRPSTESLERFAELVVQAERDASKRVFERLAVTIAETEREACAKVVGEFAQKWWSIHCASNKHMETTRKAHDDFCALQAAIRARGEK